MNILVTGNRGYIGSVLVKKLLDKGQQVTGLDTGFYQGANFGLFDYSIPQVKKDIRQVEMDDLKGFEAIIHLANISNDPMGEINPDVTYDINYKGTVRLAEIAKKAGVARFVFSSTQSVYGNSGGEEVTEESEVAPLTAYAKSKYMAEGEIAKLADNTFTPVFMRPTTVCGMSPMLRLDLLINRMTADAYLTKQVRVFSNHDVWRASLHIEDACKAFSAILTADKEKVKAQVFNVGGNENNHTTADIATMVSKVVKQSDLVFTDELGKDTRSYKSNYDKILRTIESFKPAWTTIDCIEELYKWFQKSELKSEELNKFVRINTLKELVENGKVNENLYWK